MKQSSMILFVLALLTISTIVRPIIATYSETICPHPANVACKDYELYALNTFFQRTKAFGWCCDYPRCCSDILPTSCGIRETYICPGVFACFKDCCSRPGTVELP